MFCQRWVAWALFKDNLFNYILIMSHICPRRHSNAGGAWYQLPSAPQDVSHQTWHWLRRQWCCLTVWQQENVSRPYQMFPARAAKERRSKLIAFENHWCRSFVCPNISLSHWIPTTKLSGHVLLSPLDRKRIVDAKCFRPRAP